MNHDGGPPDRSRAGAPDRSWLASAAAAVAMRPALWRTAWRQLLSLAEPGWLRRRPHLPLPPADYLRFRLVTAYGDPDAAPTSRDVVTYLSWCRDERRRGHPGSSRRGRNTPSHAPVGR